MRASEVSNRRYHPPSLVLVGIGCRVENAKRPPLKPETAFRSREGYSGSLR